jgi:hypothetical protein
VQLFLNPLSVLSDHVFRNLIDDDFRDVRADCLSQYSEQRRCRYQHEPVEILSLMGASQMIGNTARETQQILFLKPGIGLHAVPGGPHAVVYAPWLIGNQIPKMGPALFVRQGSHQTQRPAQTLLRIYLRLGLIRNDNPNYSH